MTTEQSPVLGFYRDERGNPNGDKFAQILAWTDGMLEVDHDWVQWVFPSNEPSGLNCDAPVLTQEEARAMSADPAIRARVESAFHRFLSFLGLRAEYSDEVVVIDVKEPGKVPWWMNHFEHNSLRVTRVLKSLRLTGHGDLARSFYDFLNRHRHHVSVNTMGYWERAISDDLWSSALYSS